MAFQIKTLRDQHWLLIFQDPKSVRENPHQSHQKQITDTGKKSFYNQPAAPSREWSCKKPLQVFDVDRDAPDSWVHLMLWGGISREADRSYSPRAGTQTQLHPLDKSGPVSTDEKAPEDAKAAKLLQTLPAEPMQLLALLQVTPSHITWLQGVGDHTKTW